jgi:hypothetical protein
VIRPEGQVEGDLAYGRGKGEIEKGEVDEEEIDEGAGLAVLPSD